MNRQPTPKNQPDTSAAHEIRCACGKLLFKNVSATGQVEILCRHCKHLQLITLEQITVSK